MEAAQAECLIIFIWTRHERKSNIRNISSWTFGDIKPGPGEEADQDIHGEDGQAGHDGRHHGAIDDR